MLESEKYGHNDQIRRAEEKKRQLQRVSPRTRLAEKGVPKDIEKSLDTVQGYTDQAKQWLSERPGRVWAGLGGPDYDATERLDEIIQKHQTASDQEKAEMQKNLRELDKHFKHFTDELARIAMGKKLEEQNLKGQNIYKDYHPRHMYSKEKFNEQKMKKMAEEDETFRQLNTTIAWLYRALLTEMEESRIAKKEAFTESKSFALEGVEIQNEVKNTYRDAKFFASLSQEQAARQRAENAKDYCDFLKKDEGWLDKLGLAGGAFKPANRLKNYEVQTQERLTSLGNILTEGRKRQAILNTNIFRADKGLIVEEENYQDAQNRCKYIEFYQNDQKERISIIEDYKENIKKMGSPINEVQKNKAEAWSKEAEKRAEEAEKRAKVAEDRLNAAQRLGLPTMAYEKVYEAANNVASNARTLALLEKSVADALSQGNIAQLEKDILPAIKKASEEEAKALKNEENAAKALYEQSLKERQALKSLHSLQVELEIKLANAIVFEKESLKANKELTDLFKIGKPDKIKNQKKKDAKRCAEEAHDANNVIIDIFKKIDNCKEDVAQAMLYNIFHMEMQQKDQDHFGQAVKCLHEMSDQSTTDNIQDRQETRQTEHRITFDPDAGRATINGVWTDLRLIEGFERIDEDHVRVKMRPDKGSITIAHESRDPGKTLIKKVYNKTLFDFDHQTEKYHYQIKLHSDTFENGARDKGILVITHLENGKKEEHEIDMKRLKELTITEHIINEKVPVEVTHSIEYQALPNEIINIKDVCKVGPGYEPEELQKMWKVALPPPERPDELPTLILPTGRRIKAAVQDWTETTYVNKLIGLAIREKGPTEYGPTNLKMAGSNLVPEMNDDHIKLQGQAREFQEACTKVLQQAANTGDKAIIEKAWRQIEEYDALIQSKVAILKKPFDSPPKNLDQMEVVRKRMGQTEKLLKELEGKFSENKQAIHSKRMDHDKELRERIGALRSVNDKYMKLYYQNPEQYNLEKHSSAKERKKLLDELTAAWHLNETFHVEILEDPNVTATFITEIAQGIGNATKFIEEIHGKSSQEATKAQIGEEEKIFDEIYQALKTYRTDRAGNFTAFHATIRKAINRVTELQAKVDAVKAVQEYAAITSQSTQAENMKTAFINDKVYSRAASLEQSIIKERIQYAQKEIEKRLPKATNKEIEAAAIAIKNAADTARKNAANQPENERHRLAVEAATKTAFEQAYGYANDRAVQNTLGAGDLRKKEIKNQLYEFDREIQSVRVEAEKIWKESNEYSSILAKNILDKIENDINSIKQDLTNQSVEIQEATRVRTALQFVTIETEKLEYIYTRKAIAIQTGKADDADKKSLARFIEEAEQDLTKRITEARKQAKIAQKTKVEQNEAAAFIAIRETANQRTFARTIDDMAKAAQSIAKAEGKTETEQKEAAKKALEDLMTFADAAATQANGDGEAKNAARLDTARQYVLLADKIAKAVVDAANKARTVAQKAYKDKDAQNADARRAIQVVKALSDMARMNAIMVGKDGDAAAVAEAQRASADQIAIATAIGIAAEKAQFTALKVGKSLDAQKAAARAAAQDIEDALAAEREKIRTASVNESQRKAEAAAQTIAQKTDADPQEARSAVETSIREATERIRAEITQEFIPDPDARAEILAISESLAAEYIAIFEQSKLDASIAAETLAIAQGKSEAQQKADIKWAVERVELATVTTPMPGMHRGSLENRPQIKATAAAQEAAQIRATTDAAIAARDIARAMGRNEGTEITTALQTIEQVAQVARKRVQTAGKSKAEQKEAAFIAVVRYAASQVEIAKAVKKVAEAPHQTLASMQRVLNVAKAAGDRNPTNPMAADEEAAADAARTAATIIGGKANQAADEAVKYVIGAYNDLKA